MSTSFVIWVRRPDGYTFYSNATDSFSHEDLLPEGIHSFYLPKGYVSHNEDELQSNMREYASKLTAERFELMNSPALKLQFDYFEEREVQGRPYYQSHNRNVSRFMSYFLKCKGVDSYEPVMYAEYQWFSKCHNGGLIYLRAPGEYHGLHGRDYKMSYPTDMSRIDYMIPTKAGKAIRLSTLPEQAYKVRFGIYRVRITCDDPAFCGMFMFSKNHHYTSYSLKFAMKMRAKYEVSIDLVQDGEPNAYMYAKADLVHGNDVFGGWCKALKSIKAAHPTNSLVKLLASSAWGGLQQLVVEYKTEADFAAGYDSTGMETIDLTEKANGDLMWTFLDTSKPVYKQNLRLLPFITSYSRIKVATLMEKYNLHEGVVRIQTDSITMDRPFPMEATAEFVDDAKISGDLRFYHVNRYERL